MKYTVSLLLIIAAVLSGSAQVTYPVSTYNQTPRVFKNLLLTNQQIEDNDTINEELVDLVEPMVLDSVLGTKKKPHHRLFLVGWLINKFGGYGWRPVMPVKQKFVGTSREDSHDEYPHFTENDLNFTILLHLNKYLYKTFPSYNKEAKIHRQDIRARFYPKRHPKKRYDVPPFVRDTNNLNIQQYTVHCEITPAEYPRPMMNYLFLPTLPNMGLENHPNFLNRHPTMGFFGASCLDCNHDCHPEIHPYEWIWWMNTHNGSEKDKTWLIGLLHESSNRFPGWSANPKTGKACIPFAFVVNNRAAANRTITIDNLVFGKFISANLTQLNLPATVFGLDQERLVVNLTDSKGGNIPVTILCPNPLIGGGVKFWFSDVNWDEQNHIISGLLYMATSVKDLYTAKITVSGN